MSQPTDPAPDSRFKTGIALALLLAVLALVQALMVFRVSLQNSEDINSLSETVVDVGRAVVEAEGRADVDPESDERIRVLEERVAALEYAARASAGGGPNVYTRVVTSEPYHIDKIYPSMLGPFGNQVVQLIDGAEPELVWLIGYETEVIGGETDETQSQEWMCHVNLDLVAAADHNERFSHSGQLLQGRLFSLSQGQQNLRLPPGFGVPMMSDEKMYVATQVLNLNEPEVDITVRQRVTLTFVRDAELTAPMKPLFLRPVQGMKVLEGGAGAHFGIADDEAMGDEYGPGCAIGASADGAAPWEVADEQGRTFTPHWVVEPGREVSHTNVTRYLQLPFDTTVHFIAVHLHPWAESLKLVDLTAGETVFEAGTELPSDRLGLDRVDYLASHEGLRLYKDHQYELVSVYDNKSTENSDAMASMFLYMADEAWRRPVGL